MGQRLKCLVDDSPQPPLAPPSPRHRSQLGPPLFVTCGPWVPLRRAAQLRCLFLVNTWSFLPSTCHCLPVLYMHISGNSWCIQLLLGKQKQLWPLSSPERHRSAGGADRQISRAALRPNGGPHGEAPKGPDRLHTPGCSSGKRGFFKYNFQKTKNTTLRESIFT